MWIPSYTLMLAWMFSVCSASCPDYDDEIPYDQYVCPEENPRPPGSVDCVYWCNYSSSISHQVMNSESGDIHLYLAPPFQLCFYDYLNVKLLVGEEGVSCDNLKGVSELTRVHSHHDVTLHRRNNPHGMCSQNITLEFDFVFTGCYQLDIEPKNGTNSRQNCHSQMFDVTTDYTLSRISNPNISVTPSSASVRLGAVWDIPSPFSINVVHICLTSADSYPGHQGYIAEGCILDIYSLRVINDGCSCEWIKSSPDSAMHCSFFNLNSGNYTVMIEGLDTRCQPHTLWLDSRIHGCSWSHTMLNFIAINETNLITGLDPKGIIFHWITIVFVIFLSVVFITAVLVIYYKCHRRKNHFKTIYRKVPQMDNKCREIKVKFPNEKIRILLLYPRDCQPFMDSMEALRELLSSINNFEVLDPFDQEMYEEVASCTNNWGLFHVSEQSTKVILVASRLSLKLYDALLTGCPLFHLEKHPFDTIFTQLLNQLFLVNEPYTRIFVVRLDCNDTKSLHFEHIVQCRNFTLPQCVDSLIQQIVGLPFETTLSMLGLADESLKLEAAIERYSTYINENANYLDNLLTKDYEDNRNSRRKPS